MFSFLFADHNLGSGCLSEHADALLCQLEHLYLKTESKCVGKQKLIRGWSGTASVSSEF